MSSSIFQPRPVGRTRRRGGWCSARAVGLSPDVRPNDGARVRVPALRHPVEPLMVTLGWEFDRALARQANASGWLGAAELRTLVRDGRERPETRTCRMSLAAEGSSVRGASDVQRMSADMCSMQVFAESF